MHIAFDYFCLIFNAQIMETFNTNGVYLLPFSLPRYIKNISLVFFLHFSYYIDVPGHRFVAYYSYTPNQWIHSVVNFLPGNLIALQLYVDGIMYSATRLSSINLGVLNNGKIAVGRNLIENYNYLDYTSFAVDELLFFNRTLTETEISMFAQTT